MKKEWEVEKFEKCLDKVTYTNKILRKDFKEQGDYPVVSQEKDLINGYWSNETDLFKVGKPVVVFGDHTQVIKYIDFDFILGADGVKILKPKKHIDSKYFYYYLLNTELRSLGYARHYRLLKEVMVYYPKSLSEQQRIVSLLDHCFEAIDKAKANAEQNLQNAKEVFESYLQRVFQKKGEGWEEKRFDEICVLQRGFDLPKRSRFEGDNPLVTSNGITDRIDKWKVEAPGVVTGRSGTIGNVHFIEENFWPLNTSLYIKEFHGNYERFIYYFLIHFDLKKYSSGAGVPTLNRNNVHSEKASVPKSIDVQKRIVNQLDSLYIETQQLESHYHKRIDDLEELKKSILQKAFAGELKTEKMVEEIA